MKSAAMQKPEPVTRKTLEREHGLERMIGNLLRAGVIISAIVVLTGAVIWLLPRNATGSTWPSPSRSLRCCCSACCT